MSESRAFCGLDCAKCEAYIATAAGDEAAKKRVAEKWRAEFQQPDITAANVTCDGCATLRGRLGGYTERCPVRACAAGRALPTCAHCGDYETCGTLATFLAMAPSLKPVLDGIRSSRTKA